MTDPGSVSRTRATGDAFYSQKAARDGPGTGGGFAGLTQALLDEQDARKAAGAEADAVELRRDEELPGVGDEPMSFREGVAAGGVGVIAVLGTLDAVDALQLAIPSLLGPEIQDSLGVSDAGLAVIGVGGLITTTLFAVPIGRLADRVNRMRLVGWATVFWSVAMFARGFQASATATLFPDLTVRETVQVALEARDRTHFLSAALPVPSGLAHEVSQAGAADDLIGFLGLGDYANAFVAELSTGTRRIVELTCLVAGGNRLLCLDEPTAGVAQREAEALVPLLQGLRLELDASVLIIEHDMPLIMSLSDRVYCLEQGAVIADGGADDVRDDPLVIASYLGTDDRAIDRSDAGATR